MEQKMTDSAAAMSHPYAPSIFGLGVDTLGILVGLFAVVLVIRSLTKIGGQVGAAFRFTLLGVIAQMLALTYNIVVEELAIISVPPFLLGGLVTSHHLHDALMIIGMIFFVLAAKQFSSLST